MNVAPITIHGWTFEIVNSELLISSEEDPDAHVQLSAKAAFSLLDYLYSYRDNLHEETQVPEGVPIEQKEVAKETVGMEHPPS